MAATFLNPGVELTPLVTGSWQTFNLAAYIPVEATGVMLQCQSEGWYFDEVVGIRNLGSTDSRYRKLLQCSIISYVGCNSRSIEYYVNYNDSIKIYLLGYFTNDAVFFTNATLVASGLKVWENVDTSGSVPAGARAVIIETDFPTTTPGTFGYRKNGSSDTLIQSLGGWSGGAHQWNIIGVDSNRIFQCYTGADWNAYLIGYILEGNFPDNALSFSLGLPWVTWNNKDLTTDVPSGATGLIIRTRYSSTVGGMITANFRGDGFSTDIYTNSAWTLDYPVSLVYPNTVFEYWSGDNSASRLQYYRIGYFGEDLAPTPENTWLKHMKYWSGCSFQGCDLSERTYQAYDAMFLLTYGSDNYPAYTANMKHYLGKIKKDGTIEYEQFGDDFTTGDYGYYCEGRLAVKESGDFISTFFYGNTHETLEAWYARTAFAYYTSGGSVVKSSGLEWLPGVDGFDQLPETGVQAAHRSDGWIVVIDLEGWGPTVFKSRLSKDYGETWESAVNIATSPDYSWSCFDTANIVLDEDTGIFWCVCLILDGATVSYEVYKMNTDGLAWTLVETITGSFKSGWQGTKIAVSNNYVYVRGCTTTPQDAIFRSFDGGANWEAPTYISGTTGYEAGHLAACGLYVNLVNWDGVFHSSDGGATFTKVLSTGTTSFFEFSQMKQSGKYVIINGNAFGWSYYGQEWSWFFISSDYGATYTVVTGPLQYGDNPAHPTWLWNIVDVDIKRIL